MTYFPIGVVGEVRFDANSWTAQTRINSSFQLSENEVANGSLVPVISFSDDVFYNGLQQMLVEVSPIPDGPELNPKLIEINYQGIKMNGDTYAKSTTPPTDAGFYTVVAGYQGDEAYRNYRETKDITIKPLELKTTDFFTEKPIKKQYDGTITVPEKTIVGLNNTGVIILDRNQVEFKYKSANFISKDVKLTGLNAVVLKEVTISGDKGNEYIIVDENKEKEPFKSIDISLPASVDPKPIDVILLGQDKVYDGNASLSDYKLLVNQGDLIKDDELAVSATEKFYPWYGETNTRQKDVGSYYVWATGGFYLYGINGTNSDNYHIKNETITSNKKYAITQAGVTVIPAYVTKLQDEVDPALAYAVWQDESSDGFVKGLYGNDVMYGALERESGESVGSYDIFLGSLNNSNYRITLVDGKDKFEILKRDDRAATYIGNNYENGSTEVGENEEIEEKDTVQYFRVAMLIILLIIVGGVFGKNRLTKMD